MASVIISYVMYLGAVGAYPTVYGVRLTALIAAIGICTALVCYAFYDDKAIVAFIDEHNQKPKQLNNN